MGMFLFAKKKHQVAKWDVWIWEVICWKKNVHLKTKLLLILLIVEKNIEMLPLII